MIEIRENDQHGVRNRGFTFRDGERVVRFGDGVLAVETEAEGARVARIDGPGPRGDGRPE